MAKSQGKREGRNVEKGNKRIVDERSEEKNNVVAREERERRLVKTKLVREGKRAEWREARKVNRTGLRERERVGE